MRTQSNTAFRYIKTLPLIRRFMHGKGEIFDIGGDNEMLELLQAEDINIVAEHLGDLDYIKAIPDFQNYTALEVLEHLTNPFKILELMSGTLIATVPLRIPFKRNYWDYSNDYKQHYTEFEPRAFRKLLKKTGWIIIHEQFWRRPLQIIWPKWMAVVAKKQIT